MRFLFAEPLVEMEQAMETHDPFPRLIAALGDRLMARRWMLATAESCTGGLIAARITDHAGSSAYFLGGAVVYANALKVKLLGVQQATLAAHGAVSQPVAREMAQGALLHLGAQLAISVTGIAGPDGGTPDKPVGLTYIGAAAVDGSVEVERHVWPGDRHAVRLASARRALELALFLLG
jgi:nicotinamide-nucleotide amidase